MNRAAEEGDHRGFKVHSSSPSPADYWACVEYFCALCKKELSGRFVSCIIVGSLSTGDIVPGWSDVDAYLVLDVVTDDVKSKVSSLIEKVTGKHPWLATDRGSMFSVFAVTRQELFEGGPDVSFLSQWDIKRHGIVSCGEDLRPSLPDPELDEAWINRHIEWMRSHLEDERESSPYWKAKNSIGFILNGARNAILKAGAYAKAKEELAHIFSKMYPERQDVLRSAMDQRVRWPVILENPGDVDKVYEQAMGFLVWVRSLQCSNEPHRCRVA